jgi:hypothetical protein
MSDLRRTITWLILVLVGVVGLAGALLGVSQAPSALSIAVANTKAASSYTQVVTEKTPQGDQTDYLVWQAPDRLGGYIQSGNRRTYVYVLPAPSGSVEYQSITVPVATATRHLVFYRQASQSAALLDPAHNYLQYASRAKHPTTSGSTYFFTLTQTTASGTETGHFAYTVAHTDSGQYISQFGLAVQGASVHMVISAVGSSPLVQLPAGARVVATPTTPSGGG